MKTIHIIISIAIMLLNIILHLSCFHPWAQALEARIVRFLQLLASNSHSLHAIFGGFGDATWGVHEAIFLSYWNSDHYSCHWEQITWKLDPKLRLFYTNDLHFWKFLKSFWVWTKNYLLAFRKLYRQVTRYRCCVHMNTLKWLMGLCILLFGCLL